MLTYEDIKVAKRLGERFPELNTYGYDCPNSCSRRYINKQMAVVIMHLNDTHLWTFEQIADWVDKENEYVQNC